MNDDYIIVDQTFKPLSDGIEAVCQDLDIQQLTGGSGRGWSKWRSLQQCPYAYWLRYRKKMDPPVVHHQARDIGSVVHALLAIHYLRMMHKTEVSPDAFKEALLAQNVDPENVEKGWRSFTAYKAHYYKDYLIPLAVEYPMEDKATKNTCRYDAIAKVKQGTDNVTPGTYVVEHKTASRFSAEVLDGWDLDGEILGEIGFWQRNGLDAKFGKLQGLIINLIGKQREPLMHRVFVSPFSVRTNLHIKNLAWLQKLESQCIKEKTWPQFFASCISRWGKCDYYDHCLNKGIK